MEQKKGDSTDNHRISKLIKESGLEKASDGLQRSIMSGIRKHEAVKENAMYSLLQNHASEKVSPDFTNQIMNKLHKETAKADSQLIGKYGWLAIIMGFAALVVLVFLSGGEVEATTSTAISETIDKGVSQFLDHITIGPILTLCVLVVAVLAAFDHFTAKNRISS
ncbi:MAG: hypothetical protein JKY54_04915 [Flavobacteriales bacterium]|nr:hypothetical protein [Flavobacteriales bacterium]